MFPPQPAGVWDLPYNDESWEESEGPDRYRRGIYTFVRRSALYPAMMNFDATSRESCTIRRIRTNTPMQALTTLNDTGFFEMAQALGNRLREGGATMSARRLRFSAFRRKSSEAIGETIRRVAHTRAKLFNAHIEDAKRIAPTARMRRSPLHRRAG